MMSRKDYKRFAAILRIAKERGLSPSWIAYDLCEYFKTDNSNFNKTKFLEACGIDNNNEEA